MTVEILIKCHAAYARFILMRMKRPEQPETCPFQILEKRQFPLTPTPPLPSQIELLMCCKCELLDRQGEDAYYK